MTKRALYILLFLMVSAPVFSQSYYQWKRDRRLQVYGTFGFSSYYGDLNKPGDIIDFSGYAGVGVEYFIRDHIKVRGQISYIRLTGEDSDLNEEWDRFLAFKSNNIELTALGVFELFPRGRSYYNRRKVNPYLATGLSIMYSNPRNADSTGTYHALRPIQTEGNSYSPIVFAIPLGLGVDFYLNRFWSVGLEGLYRFTFTDYLDDVSTVYVDNSSFTDPIERQLADPRIIQNPPLEARPAGWQRGDPGANDGYFTVAIKVGYYLPTAQIRRNAIRKRNSRKRNPGRYRRGKRQGP